MVSRSRISSAVRLTEVVAKDGPRNRGYEDGTRVINPENPFRYAQAHQQDEKPEGYDAFHYDGTAVLTISAPTFEVSGDIARE